MDPTSCKHPLQSRTIIAGIGIVVAGLVMIVALLTNNVESMKGLLLACASVMTLGGGGAIYFRKVATKRIGVDESSESSITPSIALVGIVAVVGACLMTGCQQTQSAANPNESLGTTHIENVNVSALSPLNSADSKHQFSATNVKNREAKEDEEATDGKKPKSATVDYYDEDGKPTHSVTVEIPDSSAGVFFGDVKVEQDVWFSPSARGAQSAQAEQTDEDEMGLEGTANTAVTGTGNPVTESNSQKSSTKNDEETRGDSNDATNVDASDDSPPAEPSAG